MGFRSWLRERFSRMARRRGSRRAGPARTASAPQVEMIAPGYPAADWEELPAYLPVDPEGHKVACIIAAAIAAGEHTESNLVLRRVSMANPEYTRVACIATALGAGALDKSSFTVKRIYRKTVTENTHAA